MMIGKPSTEFDAYLLGRAPQAERERLEARLFSDDEFFEAIRAAEDDLILRYVKKQLSRRDRRQFEREFLDSPEQVARIEVIRDLVSVSGQNGGAGLASEAQPFRRQWWPPLALQSAVAAVALLAIIAAGWLVHDVVRLRASNDRAEQSRGALNREIAQLRAERSAWEQRQRQGFPASADKPAMVLSFILIPGSPRGGQGAKLVIPSGAESVCLQLSLDSDEGYPRYRGTIRTAEGAQVWGGALKSVQPAALLVPASALPPGDYLLSLEGSGASGSFEALETYAFRVARP